MPLGLDEHDGTSNSSTMIANVENSDAAAAIDLENHKKMTNKHAPAGGNPQRIDGGSGDFDRRL